MPHFSDKTRTDDFNSLGFYRLLRMGADGQPEFYWSETPGVLGGIYEGNYRLYGSVARLGEAGACEPAHRGIAGGTYQRKRVFFASEEDAIACGFRPCGSCMKEKYKIWKAAQPK